MVAYLVVSRRRIKQHQHSIRDQYSAIEEISLQWLRTLITVLLSLFLLYLLTTAVGLFWVEPSFNPSLLLFLPIVLAIYAIGFFSLRQPAIFARRLAGPLTATLHLADPVDSSHVNDGCMPEPEKLTKKYQKISHFFV